MSYRRPQATVQQEFDAISSAIVESLKAVIVGPNKRVFDESNVSDHTLVNYGAYDAVNGNTFNYASRPADSVVDQSSVELILEDVMAPYATLSGSNVIERGALANQIKFGASGTGNFTGSSRNSAFRNRDVAIGDRLAVTAGGVTLNTHVVGLLADVTPASAGSITADAGNQAQVTKSVASTTVVANGDHAAVENTTGAVYLGNLAKGWISDTYTVECITGGVGTAAAFRVTSLHADNVASVQASALGAAMTIGTRGLVINITGTGAYVLGEKYSIVARAAFTPQVPVVVSNAYVGGFNTVYTIQVIKGGLFSENPQVLVTTNNGVDYGGPRTVAYNTALPLGALGITFKFPTSTPQNGLLLGSIFTVAVTAAANSVVRTLILSDPINSSVAAGDDLSVVFSIYKSSLTVPATGYPQFGSVAFTTTADNFNIPGSLQISDASWTDTDGTSLLPLAVSAATVIAPYTALLTGDANVYNSISDLSSVEAVLGRDVPENPLAYGVARALENSGGQAVYYVAVSSNDQAGFTDALATLESNESAYLVVPLTADLAIQQLYKAHVLTMSSKDRGFERIAFTCHPLSELVLKYNRKPSGEYWTGYVAIQPGSNPAVYTQVTIPGASFLTDAVRAGDIVRTSFSVDSLGNEIYQTAKVASVTDQQNLVLATPGFSAPVGSSSSLQRMAVTRLLTRSEQADAVAANASIFNTRRVYNVWPDQPIDAAGQQVPGHFLACSVAALKSSVVPHQPITNTTVVGWSNMNRAFRYFTPTQLDTIAAGGNLVVTQDESGGDCYVRHQLSTDPTDSNSSELSITTNLDSIAKFIRGDLKKFIGRYNQSDAFLQLVDVMIRQKISYLMTQTSTVTAGPQITRFDPKDLTVEGDPLIRTLTVVRAKIGLPYPNNNTDVTLEVI